MVDKNNQPITWLEYRAEQTGKTVEELREIMRSRGSKGGKAGGAKRPSEETKQKMREAYWSRHAKKQ